MAKGQRLKPEQIVTLLRQIDVLTTNGKTLAQACKEVATVEQSYYRWHNIYGGMKVDQARKFWPDLDNHNQSTLLYYLERATTREQLQNAHSDGADKGICAVMLDRICQELGIKTIEDLYRESEKARALATIRFGNLRYVYSGRSWRPQTVVLGPRRYCPYLRETFET